VRAVPPLGQTHQRSRGCEESNAGPESEQERTGDGSPKASQPSKQSSQFHRTCRRLRQWLRSVHTSCSESLWLARWRLHTQLGLPLPAGRKLHMRLCRLLGRLCRKAEEVGPERAYYEYVLEVGACLTVLLVGILTSVTIVQSEPQFTGSRTGF